MGGGEIFFILFIVLLLFGSKKIPEFARGLGKGIRYLKDATDDIQRDINDTVNDVKRDVNVNRQIKNQDSESNNPK